jgi:formate hydrogenlyase subunit 3/multisubunit Na+/H+ antiporter MnhD subunit
MLSVAEKPIMVVALAGLAEAGISEWIMLAYIGLGVVFVLATVVVLTRSRVALAIVLSLFLAHAVFFCPWTGWLGPVLTSESPDSDVDHWNSSFETLAWIWAVVAAWVGVAVVVFEIVRVRRERSEAAHAERPAWLRTARRWDPHE